MALEIRDLHVAVEGKEILKGVNLVVERGATNALMGPNGSGKSTLSYTLMGHPKYEITRGKILLDGASLIEMTPDQRARHGLFLAMQYPVAVSGVTLYSFLHAATSAVRGYGERTPTATRGRLNSHLMPMREFRQELNEKMAFMEMDPAFLQRYLNEGFSGGEKKRAEILQMALLKPKIAILDETDSGLDIDALRLVSEGINTLQKDLNMGLLVITHYQRILNYIHPDVVHVFVDGRIVKTGDAKLVDVLEEQGYEWVRQGMG
ncbi:MAG: Fe-S cluster assembly ATPase SufC [Anaerolineae bacterium]|jgi:Fe-S cluster assembly ATP-binding protein|nr:Fe-S cluster assembly ATPase SufC [Anaerolineae bacterium]